jgi:hypothetical protein
MITAEIKKEDINPHKMLTMAPANDATYKLALKEMLFKHAEDEGEVKRIDRINNVLNKVCIIFLVIMLVLVRLY